MRIRLLLAFALVIAVTLAAVALYAQQATVSEVRAFLGRGGWVGAEGIAANLEDYYAENGSWAGVESLLTSRGRGRQGRGNEEGAPAASGSVGNLILADDAGEVVYSPEETQIGSRLSAETLDNAVPLVVAEQVRGYLLPQSGSAYPESGFEDALIRIVRQASTQAAVISGVLALVLALVLATLLTRPVRSLTEAASRLARGNLETRVQVGQPRELARLGTAFNQMAESLEQAQANRKALTADVAHELRTPLAVQRAQLEALQDGIYPLSQENISPVLAQNLLLTRLVEDLRTLALADAGELRLEKRGVDLASLVRETAARFQPQAIEKDIRIILDTPGECPGAQVDPERIQQVIHNLLQNELRYTPAGGQVVLQMRCSEGQFRLTVRDNGPGIPPESLPFLFDRFYRADKARDREQGGTGLGLAIARQLVLAHGGELTAGNHVEGGAVFEMTLPLGG